MAGLTAAYSPGQGIPCPWLAIQAGHVTSTAPAVDGTSSTGQHPAHRRQSYQSQTYSACGKLDRQGHQRIAQHAAFWGEQVAPAVAMLVAKAAGTACAVEGMTWLGL